MASLVAAVVGSLLSAAIFFTLTLLVWRFCRGRKRSIAGSYEKIVSDHRLQQVTVEKGSNIPATAVR
ncbi:hypothetical protein V1264_012871 [Littorina saxatilis]|uniref:Uncharacterized protein n=1 Tax=Littorina saxatilis TaxID=31220 RepID=A0AAN9BY44_9CAEN